jgi:hypothetical protein
VQLSPGIVPPQSAVLTDEPRSGTAQLPGIGVVEVVVLVVELVTVEVCVVTVPVVLVSVDVLVIVVIVLLVDDTVVRVLVSVVVGPSGTVLVKV